MSIGLVIFVLIILVAVIAAPLFNRSSNHDNNNGDYLKDNAGNLARKRTLLDSGLKSRRDFYREDYLKSDEWKRKRFLVMRRDNWQCVYCGDRATQVHHKRYARRNIGKEPIDWLVSICKSCHDKIHHKV